SASVSDNRAYLIFGIDNWPRRPFQERVPVRTKHISPRKTKQARVNFGRLPSMIGHLMSYEVIERSLTQEGAIFLSEAERVGWNIPFGSAGINYPSHCRS